jgi:hypothetical protein
VLYLGFSIVVPSVGKEYESASSIHDDTEQVGKEQKGEDEEEDEGRHGRRGRDDSENDDDDDDDDDDSSRRKRRHLDDCDRYDQPYDPASSEASSDNKGWNRDYSQSNSGGGRGRPGYKQGERGNYGGHSSNGSGRGNGNVQYNQGFGAGQFSGGMGMGMGPGGMGMAMMDPSTMSQAQMMNQMMYLNQMAAMGMAPGGMGMGFPGAPVAGVGVSVPGAMPAPPPGAPPPPPPSGPPPIPRGMPPRQQHQQQNHQSQHESFGRERGGGGGGRHSNQNQLPEGERCTIKCSGVPTYTKPSELLLHFHSFGQLVATRTELNGRIINADELAAVQAQVGAGEGKGTHQYYDFHAQYCSPEDARKCHSSAKAVLGNRFIKVFVQGSNLVPPGEANETAVAALDAEIASLKNASNGLGSSGPSNYNSGRPLNGASDFHARRAAGGNMKWKATAVGAPGEESATGASADAPVPYFKKPYNAVRVSANKPDVAAETKRKFLELQQLKQAAEEFYHKKRDLLQVSVMLHCSCDCLHLPFLCGVVV